MVRPIHSLDRLEDVVGEDSDRIVRHLDEVVQRLFTLGLGLASTAGSCRDSATRSRLSAVTDEVDQCVRLVRRSVLELHRDTGS